MNANETQLIIRWQDSQAKLDGFESFWNGEFWSTERVAVGYEEAPIALASAAPGMLEFIQIDINDVRPFWVRK
jgi:hypothetical protein